MIAKGETKTVTEADATEKGEGIFANNCINNYSFFFRSRSRSPGESSAPATSIPAAGKDEMNVSYLQFSIITDGND